ncbi:hypothetical protein LCGC14_2043600 [marine sediment metagenome]|uniref:Uncharacterized protein n=1 Tax=marine sediment metagenome TaxID=412755 RepID=A0A0F9HN40_9ZZZZ
MPNGIGRFFRKKARAWKSINTRSTLKLGPRFATRGGLHRVAMQKLNKKR